MEENDTRQLSNLRDIVEQACERGDVVTLRCVQVRESKFPSETEEMGARLTSKEAKPAGGTPSCIQRLRAWKVDIVKRGTMPTGIELARSVSLYRYL